MDFDVFWCKMKKRSCLLCLFSLLLTFVELKTMKTSTEVKKVRFVYFFYKCDGKCWAWMLAQMLEKSRTMWMHGFMDGCFSKLSCFLVSTPIIRLFGAWERCARMVSPSCHPYSRPLSRQHFTFVFSPQPPQVAAGLRLLHGRCSKQSELTKVCASRSGESGGGNRLHIRAIRFFRIKGGY